MNKTFIESRQKIAREKAKPFYFDEKRTAQRMCVTVDDLDYLIKDTILATEGEIRKRVEELTTLSISNSMETFGVYVKKDDIISTLIPE